MQLHRTPTHRSPVRSVLLGAAGVLLGLGLLATPAAAQSGPSDPVTDGGGARDQIGHRLEHADPANVVALLDAVLGADFRFQAQRTGGRTEGVSVLFVTGPANRLPAIRTLVEALDVPANRSTEDLVLEFYEIGDATDRSLAFETLDSLTDEDARERFSVSPAGMASVFAAPQTQERVAAGLEKLNARSTARASDEATAAPEPSAPRDVLLRLTWLVTAPDEESGRAVGPDMTPVVEQLQNLGLDGWREFGRTTVLASRRSAFSISTDFTPTNGGPWNLRWKGMLQTGAGERAILSNDVNLLHASGGGAINLSTSIDLEPGRRVVLGLTPVLDQHSVLVIESTEPIGE